MCQVILRETVQGGTGNDDILVPAIGRLAIYAASFAVINQYVFILTKLEISLLVTTLCFIQYWLLSSGKFVDDAMDNAFFFRADNVAFTALINPCLVEMQAVPWQRFPAQQFGRGCTTA